MALNVFHCEDCHELYDDCKCPPMEQPEKENKRCFEMEIEVKASVYVEEGKHSGEITKVEYRQTPFEYTDIYIRVDGVDATLKYGVPTKLSPNTALGVLLSSFGQPLQIGQRIDPEKALVGKKCEFLVMTQTKGEKKYSEVVKNSLRPNSKDKAKDVVAFM
jgi:hypothetical protein